MSILTTLALMTGAVVAKLRMPDADVEVEVEVTRLQARVDELDRQLTNLERDLATTRIEADRWRALVERYQGRAEQQLPAGPDFGPHYITEEMRLRLQAQHQTRELQAMAQAQAQQDQAQLAQYNQGLAAVNYPIAQAQGLLGAYEGFCNCVPARHDMFGIGH
jgi:hypothetical protein